MTIDTSITAAQALAQNPNSPAPESVLAELTVVPVQYIGFDGNLHEGVLVIHQSVRDDIEAFFSLACELRFPIEKVIPISHPDYAWDDERSCADNNTSGYNYRLISGGTRLSNHARGLAFDVNPVQNPYIRYDQDLKEFFRVPPRSVYDETTAGTLTKSHPLVLLMKDRGWAWGGDWTPSSGREDFQHFEKQLL